MKTAHMVGALVLLLGAYLEYQKDSSFATVDTGSLLMGTGAGIFLGHVLA